MKQTVLLRQAFEAETQSAGDKLLIHVIRESDLAASYSLGHGLDHRYGRTSRIARKMAQVRRLTS